MNLKGENNEPNFNLGYGKKPLHAQEFDTTPLIGMNIEVNETECCRLSVVIQRAINGEQMQGNQNPSSTIFKPRINVYFKRVKCGHQSSRSWKQFPFWKRKRMNVICKGGGATYLADSIKGCKNASIWKKNTDKLRQRSGNLRVAATSKEIIKKLIKGALKLI